jgi:hypothetical protein
MLEDPSEEGAKLVEGKKVELHEHMGPLNMTGNNKFRSIPT